MYNLRKSLKASGYRGACENEEILTWAIRTGTASKFYNDLIIWLDVQFRSTKCTEQVRNNIRNSFAKLRGSTLMIPHAGSEVALNPKEFRLQTLKMLMQQLELSSKFEKEAHISKKSPKKEFGYNSLSITLDTGKSTNSGNWNERRVHRVRSNFSEIY